MNMVKALVQAYRDAEEVAFWSEDEKAAARSAVLGVAVQAGVFSEFKNRIVSPAGAIKAEAPMALPDNVEPLFGPGRPAPTRFGQPLHV